DESIPWEDRYWLDRRVRSAISQNLHTFFDTEGNPVHVDADGIFPGEFYWREHMIVDPAGWNVPEGADRPLYFEEWDIGHLYNPYGYRVGEYALALPTMSISRDGNIAADAGLVSLIPEETFPVETFEFIMFPDGSYRDDIVTNPDREYDAVVAPDGSVAVFFCIRASQESISDGQADTYVLDSDGNVIRSFTLPIRLKDSWLPTISENGRYACHYTGGATACLIDCYNGTAEFASERTDYSRNCAEYSFSPDGEYLCMGGSITGQIREIDTGDITLMDDETPSDATSEFPFTSVNCSNGAFCVTRTTFHRYESDNLNQLAIYLKDIRINTIDITSSWKVTTEISPNGYFLIANPIDAAHGNPSHFSGSDLYNLPLIVMQIESR
ncbi:MAG: hypothetical protein K8S24_05395, partial [Candidatus Aegiribacteria sp.]|nr:hypothetical protein [Candidatus Aegiribacteria sp.]